jgi:hypothetical protein
MVCATDQNNNIACMPCGQQDEYCCTGSACDVNLGCLVPSQGGPKHCIACGGELERCCPYGTGCRDGRTCMSTMGMSYCSF